MDRTDVMQCSNKNDCSKSSGSLLKEFIYDEDGIGVVEVILILVVLISLVLLFKDKITSLANTIFSKINTNANKV